jgi:hypothetical protein
MFQPPQSVLRFGAGALALGVLLLAAPRAAHGIAATLVQVTNTPANPAIAQSPDTQAAQLIEVTSGFVFPGSVASLQLFSMTKFLTGIPYVVPAGQNLVITAVDITPAGCTNLPTVVSLRVTAAKDWSVGGGTTFHFDYPSGIVIGPGLSPNITIDAGQPCGAKVDAHGYLTSN